MTTRVSRRAQKLLAVLLLVLASACLWKGILAPIVTYGEGLSQRRGADLAALSRDRAVLSQDPQVIETLNALGRNTRWNRLYVSDKSDQALLQFETDVRDLVKAATNATSMTAEPIVAQGLLSRMGVRVSLSLPIDQWTDLLVRLQAHAKLLELRNLTIQAPDYQPVDSNPTLSIQAEFVGYLFKRSGQSP
jgi:hypothetical protein